MSEITIALDAGHGGSDPGATYKGRQEKDDTLRLVQAVGKILETNGVNVVYTRTNDIYETPFKKATDANNAGADYFVSIHRNSSEQANQYNGVETLVYNNAGIKSEMAKNVNAQLAAVGFKNLGIDERTNLVVLRRTQMPAILVEVGFINNDTDNAILDNNFNKVAEAIADGILMTLYDSSPGNSRITSIDEDHTNNNFDFTNSDNNPSTDTNPNDMQYEENLDYPDIDQYYNTNNNNIDNEIIDDYIPRDNTLKNISNRMPIPPMADVPLESTIPPISNASRQENPYNQQTSANGALYRVQVGAYRNKDNADRMLNALLIEGFPAFIIYEDNLYKVQVGAFQYLTNAVKMEHRLRRFRYNTYIVYA